MMSYSPDGRVLVRHTGLEPQTSRPQAGLRLTRARLALDSGDAESWSRVKAADGILVPGGFGDRGTQGKIEAIAHARREKVPFLGICLGMQLAVVEFARNELGMPDATSNPNPYPHPYFFLTLTLTLTLALALALILTLTP